MIMNVLITAGGTIEPIDSVRSITNHSTGALSKIIHDTLDSDVHIHYVAANVTALPDVRLNTTLYRAFDTQSVAKTITSILKSHSIDVMIHAMAVSDFYVETVVPAELFQDQLKTALLKQTTYTPATIEMAIKETLNQSINRHEKIKSDDGLIVKMSPTEKIIQSVKKISPSTLLIGFKLLHNSTQEALIEAAWQQQQNSGCDFVVANDSVNITSNTHEALLIRGRTILNYCTTKKEIANAIQKEIIR